MRWPIGRNTLQLTLEQRLLRFLVREERDEQRTNRELRAQPVELRVLEGECIEGAVYLRANNGNFVFQVPAGTALDNVEFHVTSAIFSSTANGFLGLFAITSNGLKCTIGF